MFLLTVLAFASFIYSASSISGCDNGKIKKIYEKFGCPKDWLSYLYGCLGTVTVKFATNTPLFGLVRCATLTGNLTLNSAGQTVAYATLRTHFKNGTCVKTVFKQIDNGCGNITEIDLSTNLTYKLYGFNILNAMCYHRCKDGETGGPMSVLSVPLERQFEKSVFKAEVKYIGQLEAVGLPPPAHYDYMHTCPAGFNEHYCG